MGSGSCGIVSKKLNRKFYGIEIDETYFNTAEIRIKGTQCKFRSGDKVVVLVAFYNREKGIYFKPVVGEIIGQHKDAAKQLFYTVHTPYEDQNRDAEALERLMGEHGKELGLI